MSYTDLRDFELEYVATLDTLTIQLEKLGGGTLGRAYVGTWRYIATDADGSEVARGQDLHTGMPKTHKQAARILADFLATDAES